MRTITLPRFKPQPAGRWVEYPVVVDWPELQLTEEQVMANAVALAQGRPTPYPNHAIFSVRIPNEPVGSDA